MSDFEPDMVDRLFTTLSTDPTLPVGFRLSCIRLQHYAQSSCESFSQDLARSLKQLATMAKHDPQLDNQVRNLINLSLDNLSLDNLSLANLSMANLSLDNLSMANPSMDNKNNAPSLELLNQQMQHLIAHPDSTLYDHANQNPSTAAELKEFFNQTITASLRNKHISDDCKHLLFELWPNALFHIIRHHGKDSSHWLNAIEMYIELIDAIQPIENIKQYRQLSDRYLALVRSHNNMLLIYHPDERVEPAIKSLLARFTQLLGIKPGSSIQEGSSQPQENHLSAIEKIACLPANIKPGIWVEFNLNSLEQSLILKLSIINIDTGELVFVDRSGIRKMNKDALAFSHELRNGESKIHLHKSPLRKPQQAGSALEPGQASGS